MKYRIVKDNHLGEIFFPASDSVISCGIEANGIWEPLEFSWLKANLRKGDSFLNIGANVGYFSLLASSLVGKTGMVYAVEPNPFIIPFLRVNSVRSKFQNIQILEMAASDKNETKFLYQNFRNFGDSRLFDPRVSDVGGDYIQHGFDATPLKSLVESRVLDDLNLKNLTVVLSDTQGWDFFALMGLKRTITLYRPKILCEFVPDWLISNGVKPQDAINEFASWNYEIRVLEDKRLIVQDFSQVTEFMNDNGCYFVNLILTPKKP